MSYTIVGEQIQKFRKALRMTQKELGEAIGVSSSAVSQWESGGTPDVSLLPSIADRLGVTVDALFGRETASRETMRESLPRYVASLPEHKRVGEVCRLAWEAMRLGCVGPFVPDDHRAQDYHLYYASEDGMMLGASPEGTPFMFVCPEPEKGFEAFFAEDGAYGRLFGALTRPHGLALLKLMYRRPPRHCTVGVIARGLGVPLEEAEALLAEFVALRLVERIELEAEDGCAEAYMVSEFSALPPFLYAARLMTESFGGFRMVCNKRKAPLLRPGRQDGEGA